MHPYRCAIDCFAEPNGLPMTCPQALFCGAPYKPFLDIMQDHEWLAAIRLWARTRCISSAPGCKHTKGVIDSRAATS